MPNKFVKPVYFVKKNYQLKVWIFTRLYTSISKYCYIYANCVYDFKVQYLIKFTGIPPY